MGIDRFIFRRPPPSYTESEIINGLNENTSIEWIPNDQGKIPVMVMMYEDSNGRSNDSYILYFHGNSEDLGTAKKFLNSLKETLHVNIIAMEYAGYGIYSGKKPSANQIKKDALTVYDYLVNKEGILESKIIVFGRSIGSGPACEIASIRQPANIILVSAFTSIKKLTGDLTFSLFSFFVKERFNNIECASKFKSPCILIHGEADSLIKPDHSKTLYAQIKQNGKKNHLELRQNMSHNNLNILRDIVLPIKRFFQQINYKKRSISLSRHPRIILNQSQDICLTSTKLRLLSNQDANHKIQEISVPNSKEFKRSLSLEVTDRCTNSIEFKTPVMKSKITLKPYSSDDSNSTMEPNILILPS